MLKHGVHCTDGRRTIRFAPVCSADRPGADAQSGKIHVRRAKLMILHICVPPLQAQPVDVFNILPIQLDKVAGFSVGEDIAFLRQHRDIRLGRADLAEGRRHTQGEVEILLLLNTL